MTYIPGKIDETPLTTTAITPTTTIVDDTVMLVDGTSLTGSQVTPSPDIRASTSTNAPQARIQPNR